MQQIVRINLDNEMDLILAHKRTMKLAELCGLSLSAQTIFATAVSEVARCAINYGKKSYMELGIDALPANKKEIVAILFDTIDLSGVNSDAFSYAGKLMGKLHMELIDGWYQIKLKHLIQFSGIITQTKIQGFKEYFKNEPPLSPYDEIRKKNIQLIDLSDKLKESENQYRLLTDTLPLMMFAINLKGEVTYSNKGLMDFLGTSNTQVNSVLWQSMVHPEDYRRIWKDWDKSMGNLTAFHGQGRLKQKGSENFIWHLISIVPVKNDKNLVTYWIGFFVDIHAQKQVEETLKDNRELQLIKSKLEEYQGQLEEKIAELNISNHDLEQFAYIASHDLQEPLRKIKTFSDLLSNVLQLDAREQSYFDKIVSSADRMSTLIRDVLNYSRLSNVGDQFRETNLEDIFEQVKTDLELLIEERSVVLSKTALPVIKGIPLQLSQLFANIIGNSIKFSKEQPVISLSSTTLSSEQAKAVPGLSSSRNYHRLVFTDNGIGFEKQYASQIFTIFQRLNDRQAYSGTGIGLALCKKIVENHSGLIVADSEPGKGSSFYVYLPVN